MIDRTSLLLLKRAIGCYVFTENIVLDNMIQNLLNLRMNYPRRFLHLSLLLISIYTVHLFGKLVKRKFQEVIFPLMQRDKMCSFFRNAFLLQQHHVDLVHVFEIPVSCSSVLILVFLGDLFENLNRLSQFFGLFMRKPASEFPDQQILFNHLMSQFNLRKF